MMTVSYKHFIDSNKVNVYWSYLRKKYTD